MIQASDLRIGNIHAVDPLMIPKWGIKGSGYARVTAYGICAVESGHIEFVPVPLTEEILLKAGFKESSLSTEWNDKKVYYMNWVNNNQFYGGKNKRLYVYGGHEGLFSLDRWFRKCVNIDYVHQLQNTVFILTQTELEIKL